MDDIDSETIAFDDSSDTQHHVSFKQEAIEGRLHGALAHRLGVEILSGIYAPGDTLPNEIQSSSVLNISRSAYREAIRILAAKGMVESKPKTGTKVTDRNRWNLLDPDILRWMFETEPSEEFILGLFELRLITEPSAAALAAQRRQQHHLDTMEHALENMTKFKLQTEQWRKADLEFHDALIQATNNEALGSLSSSIGAAVAWSTRFKQRRGGLQRDPVPDHFAVFEAIRRQDASDARWCMETLIRYALRDTQASIHIAPSNA